MVDAVTTVQISSSALRASPQNAGVSASAAAVQNIEEAAPGVTYSAIRVDNLQNVAILEYRSTKTGEVVQQYPTQVQIDAFKRAAHHVSRGQSAGSQQARAPSAAAAQPAHDAAPAHEGASSGAHSVLV